MLYFILIQWKINYLIHLVRNAKNYKPVNRLKQRNTPMQSLLFSSLLFSSLLFSSLLFSSLLFSSLLFSSLLFSSCIFLHLLASSCIFSIHIFHLHFMHLSSFYISYFVFFNLLFVPFLLASLNSLAFCLITYSNIFSSCISSHAIFSPNLISLLFFLLSSLIRLYCVCWIIRAIFKFYSFSYLFILPRCFHQQSY